eukprot:COSAG02_NODE_52567_length_307_cov_0.668269_1_plen_51_part_01
MLMRKKRGLQQTNSIVPHAQVLYKKAKKCFDEGLNQDGALGAGVAPMSKDE